MADGSNIEWTDATAIVDRDGARIRYYHRKDPARPGQQQRRLMLTEGKKWCRGCFAWLDAASVGKNGLCRPHENKDAKLRYAEDGNYRQRRKDHAVRKSRGVERVDSVSGINLRELFEGKCAYCDNEARTWDHVIPVSKGGATVEGNIIPACTPCNSSKRDSDIDDWLDRAPKINEYTIDYLSHMGALRG